MFPFILGLILLVGAIILFTYSRKHVFPGKPITTRSGYTTETTPGEPIRWPNHLTLGLSIGLAFIAALFVIAGVSYTQTAGEANVITDITGNIDGSSTATGLHPKAPWQDVTEYNIRNQQVVFLGHSQNDPDNTGGKANGPQITVQDADGVTSNIDIAVRYSIRPESVVSIYKSFKTESNFRASFIMQDVRSAVRSVPNQFKTLDLLTARTKVESAIQSYLEERWADDGVSIDSVSLQEIRAPKAVTEAYAAAQKAQVNISTQQAKLDATKISSQNQIVQAQAKAKANDLLSQSLTESVLKQNYLDTLASLGAKGNLVVVPNGFNGILNLK